MATASLKGQGYEHNLIKTLIFSSTESVRFCVVFRALVGSVSDHCAQNAKCPVVIVKHPTH